MAREPWPNQYIALDAPGETVTYKNWLELPNIRRSGDLPATGWYLKVVDHNDSSKVKYYGTFSVDQTSYGDMADVWFYWDDETTTALDIYYCNVKDITVGKGNTVTAGTAIGQDLDKSINTNNPEIKRGTGSVQISEVNPYGRISAGSMNKLGVSLLPPSLPASTRDSGLGGVQIVVKCTTDTSVEPQMVTIPVELWETQNIIVEFEFDEDESYAIYLTPEETDISQDLDDIAYLKTTYSSAHGPMPYPISIGERVTAEVDGEDIKVSVSYDVPTSAPNLGDNLTFHLIPNGTPDFEITEDVKYNGSPCEFVFNSENYDTTYPDGYTVIVDYNGNIVDQPRFVPAASIPASATVDYLQRGRNGNTTVTEAWLKIVNPDGEDVKVYNGSTLLATIPWVASDNEKTVIMSVNGSQVITKIVIGTEEFAQSGYPGFYLSWPQMRLAQAYCYNSPASLGLVNEQYDITLEYDSANTSTKRLDASSSANLCIWNMTDFPGVVGFYGAWHGSFESVNLHDYDYIENGVWKHGQKKYSGNMAGIIWGGLVSGPATVNPDNSITFSPSSTSKINYTGDKLFVRVQTRAGANAPYAYTDYQELAPNANMNNLTFPKLYGEVSATNGLIMGATRVRNSAGQYVASGWDRTMSLPTLSSHYDTKVFKRWLKDSQPYDFNTPVTSNITLTGEWAECYTVKFVDYDGSTLAPDQSVVQGSDFGVVLPSNPTRAGFTFNGWVNMNTNKLWTNGDTVNSNMVLAANYTENT